MYQQTFKKCYFQVHFLAPGAFYILFYFQYLSYTQSLARGIFSF